MDDTTRDKGSAAQFFFAWLAWIVIFALLISGKPWDFPRGGQGLLEPLND